MIRSQWNGPAKKLNIGFIRADNNFVEDIEECKIAEPALNEQIKQVRANPPPQGRHQGGAARAAGRLGRAARLVFPEQFFPAAEAGRRPCAAFCATAARGIWLICIAASAFSALNRRMWWNRSSAWNTTSWRSRPRGKTRRHGQINNGEFIAAKVEDVLPELLQKFSPEKTAVILDPPRKGCWPETLELLRQTKPAQVIYVSCHPATMARDLNILCGDGVFELARVQPLDMFPQTQHVECVADLRGDNTPAMKRNLPKRGSWIQLDKTRMPNENQTDPRKNFVPRCLPWLLAAAACWSSTGLTLNHWVSLLNLRSVAKLSGWIWQPEVFNPAFFLRRPCPFRWLPAAQIPDRAECFFRRVRGADARLLARSVAILPHDRTEAQRQRERSDFSFLTGSALAAAGGRGVFAACN